MGGAPHGLGLAPAFPPLGAGFAPALQDLNGADHAFVVACSQVRGDPLWGSVDLGGDPDEAGLYANASRHGSAGQKIVAALVLDAAYTLAEYDAVLCPAGRLPFFWVPPPRSQPRHLLRMHLGTVG